MRAGASGSLVPQLGIIPAESNLCERGLSIEVEWLLMVKGVKNVGDDFPVDEGGSLSIDVVQSLKRIGRPSSVQKCFYSTAPFEENDNCSIMVCRELELTC